MVLRKSALTALILGLSFACGAPKKKNNRAASNTNSEEQKEDDQEEKKDELKPGELGCKIIPSSEVAATGSSVTLKMETSGSPDKKVFQDKEFTASTHETSETINEETVFKGSVHSGDQVVNCETKVRLAEPPSCTLTAAETAIPIFGKAKLKLNQQGDAVARYIDRYKLADDQTEIEITMDQPNYHFKASLLGYEGEVANCQVSTVGVIPNGQALTLFRAYKFSSNSLSFYYHKADTAKCVHLLTDDDVFIGATTCPNQSTTTWVVGGVSGHQVGQGYKICHSDDYSTCSSVIASKAPSYLLHDIYLTNDSLVLVTGRFSDTIGQLFRKGVGLAIPNLFPIGFDGAYYEKKVYDKSTLNMSDFTEGSEYYYCHGNAGHYTCSEPLKLRTIN